jgi:prophage DNA circulation protein
MADASTLPQWRQNMQPGSFRGVPFLATSSDLNFGRNAAVHEFPLGETPQAQDLGAKANRFALEIFVIGPTYMAQRDALISALTTPGPGTLIHPWQGSKTVQLVGEARCRESAAEGGMAVFNVTFAQTPAQSGTATTVDTGAVVATAASDVQTQASDSAVERLDVAGQPAFVQAGAVSVVGQLASALTAASNVAGAVGTSVYSLQAGILSLSEQALPLLSTPADLIGSVQTTLGQIAELADYPEDALSAMAGLMGFGSPVDSTGGSFDLAAPLPAAVAAVTLPTPLTTTTSGQIEAANQTAICQTVQALAAAQAAEIASGLTFSSYNQAAATRDQLAASIDDMAIAAAEAGDPDLWSSLSALRLAVIQDITARGASLARLYAYTPPTTLPALVIAYSLYGDATQADDIVARNAIQHPLFVAGGQPIQVLTEVSS